MPTEVKKGVCLSSTNTTILLLYPYKDRKFSCFTEIVNQNFENFQIAVPTNLAMGIWMRVMCLNLCHFQSREETQDYKSIRDEADL